LSRFLRFLTFFYFNLNVFYIYDFNQMELNGELVTESTAVVRSRLLY